MPKRKLQQQVQTPRTARRNVEIVATLQKKELASRSLGERMGDTVSNHVGTITAVAIHLVWFVGWIVVNRGGVPGIKTFDEFPFGLLTLVVSLEAIFLSLFLLISQNRMNRQAEKRANFDLQVNMLIEAEVTKTLWVLKLVSDKVGVDLSNEPELRDLAAPTDLRHLAQAVEKALPTP